MEEFDVTLSDYTEATKTRNVINRKLARLRPFTDFWPCLMITIVFTGLCATPLTGVLSTPIAWLGQTPTASTLSTERSWILYSLLSSCLIAWILIQPIINYIKEQRLLKWESNDGLLLRQKFDHLSTKIQKFEDAHQSRIQGDIDSLYHGYIFNKSSKSDNFHVHFSRFEDLIYHHIHCHQYYFSSQPAPEFRHLRYIENRKTKLLSKNRRSSPHRMARRNFSEDPRTHDSESMEIPRPENELQPTLDGISRVPLQIDESNDSSATLHNDVGTTVRQARNSPEEQYSSSFDKHKRFKSIWPIPDTYTPIHADLPSNTSGSNTTHNHSGQFAVSTEMPDDSREQDKTQPEHHQTLSSHDTKDRHRREFSTHSVRPPSPETVTNQESEKWRQNSPPRVIDWEEVDHRRRSIGAEGEKIALDFEINRLLEKFRADLAHQVRHVSAEDGDGLGYDILSFNTDGTQRFIEVKSTTDSQDAPFFMSQRELEHILANQSNSFIYHVLLNRNQPELSTIRIYPAVDVLDFRRVPTVYKVDPRSIRFGQT